MKVDIADVSVGFRIRKLNADRVKALADNIKETGYLLQPIAVYFPKTIQGANGLAKDGYGLIAGEHRLAACKLLGWTEIEVVTHNELNDNQRIIAECDENLLGTNLSATERALFTAKRKAAYEAENPGAKAGVAGGKAGSRAKGKKITDIQNMPVISFVNDTAAKTGRSKSVVEKEAQRGNNIDQEVLNEVVGSEVDKVEVLDTLAKLTTKEKIKDEDGKTRTVTKPNVKAQKAKLAEIKDAAKVKASKPKTAKGSRMNVGAELSSAAAIINEQVDPDGRKELKALLSMGKFTVAQLIKLIVED